jgi:ATP-dependent DNA helicase RecQ
MHEFFLDRDYPPASDLARVAQVLTDEYLMPEPLAQRLKMGFDTFSKAIEKLTAQGAASIDLAGNVRRAGSVSTRESWRAGYDAQIAFRRAQLDRMAAFAETQQCRMTAVIRHFGDIADAHRPCGRCDFCSPSTTSAQTFAEPTTAQSRDLRAILSALAHAPSRATGKLHTDLALGVDRKQFDTLLDALARAGLITLTAETFTNSEGKVLPYKKAALTHEGRSDDASELTGVVLPATSESESAHARSRTRKPSGSRASGTNQRALRRSAEDVPANLTAEQKNLDAALRAWRKSEAAKTGKPAFIVLSDAVLRNIAVANPQSLSELLAVSGIGPNKADQFGADIIALCRTQAAPDRASATTPNAPQILRASQPPLRDKALPSGPAREAKGVSHISPGAPAAPNVPTGTEFHRAQPESDPTAALTSEQLALDAQLRAWRKAESERIGLPQFFVLGASALRSIVLRRPRTIAELQTIAGIGADKAEKFGAAICSLCNSSSANLEVEA